MGDLPNVLQSERPKGTRRRAAGVAAQSKILADDPIRNILPSYYSSSFYILYSKLPLRV